MGLRANAPMIVNAVVMVCARMKLAFVRRGGRDLNVSFVVEKLGKKIVLYFTQFLLILLEFLGWMDQVAQYMMV